MRKLRARAWWYLVAFSALIVVFGFSDVLLGAAADPGIALGVTGVTLPELEAQSAPGYRMYDFTTRTQGWNLTVIGVLLLAILLVPYRAGRRWAWWALWILPAWSFGIPGLYVAVGLAPSQPPPPPLISGPVLGAIAAAALLVDRRRFHIAASEGP